MKLPDGQRYGNRIKIAVKLDVETFQRLKTRAKRDGKMFSEVVNDCCKCGLLDLEDSEADEPATTVILPYALAKAATIAALQDKD